MVEVLGVLIPFAFFALVFGIIYVRYTVRNRERMAMIEKGVDASFFETQKGEKKSYGTMIFKLGMFIVGVGLGVVAAYLLSTSGNMHEGAAYPSMILIFGGIALIVVYLIEQKRLKAEDK